MAITLSGTTGVALPTGNTPSMTNYQGGVLTSGTAWTYSTAVSSITFTSIPSWVKRVTVMLSGVSTNGTGWLQVQLGTGGTAQITGYNSIGTGINSTGVTSSTTNNTTGFGIINEAASAAATRVGTFVFTNITGNTWMANIQFGLSDATRINFGAGNVTLSGTLDTIRIIGSATGNPADTFDAGSINILYE